jgi:hypothetical protein
MAKEYNISRTSGLCGGCQKPLTPGEDLMATVREAGEELQRQDFCLACWQASPRESDPAVLAVWRMTLPQPQEKKKLFVDDELLSNFFQRLADAQDPAMINFRFVLALVLMRKRLLVYDRMEKQPDGGEVWSMHFKGDQTPHSVVNPNMDDDKIAQVSLQLGQILQGEL